MYIISIIAFVCSLFAGSVMAGNTRLTESSSDKLKCASVDGIPACAVETSGSFSITAKISGDTFESRGITLNTIDRDTVVAIEIGDFSFSKSLGEANKLVLNSRKLSAKWTKSHESCNKRGVCKPVVDTIVTINTNDYGVTITATGQNKKSETIEYGNKIYTGLCVDNGNGYLLDEQASLSVSGEIFSISMTGKCKVKTKHTTKYDEPFDLNTITVNAHAHYAD